MRSSKVDMILLVLLLSCKLIMQDLTNIKEPLPIEKCQVSGFLYKSIEGQYILSQESQLKSCCIGSKSKINSQIVCSGFLDDALNKGVINLSGTLDQEQGQFVLRECHIVEKKRFPIKTLLMSSIAILFFILRKRNRNKKFEKFKKSNLIK